MMRAPLIICLFLINFRYVLADGFTQADREMIIRTEVRLNEFMKSTEMRFEQIDKRFEQIDKRFEQIDKRFEQVDKRFEQVDKRFEDMNNRFQDMMNILLVTISVFAASMGGCFAYMLWDRRTFLKASLSSAQVAMDDKISEIQKEGKLIELIRAMRELAKDDPKVKGVLIKFHLL